MNWQKRIFAGACQAICATGLVALCGLQATRVDTSILWVVGILLGIAVIFRGFWLMLVPPVSGQEVDENAFEK